MNHIAAVLIALLLVSESLLASPYTGLRRCGVLGQELAITQDVDPILKKGTYYRVQEFEETVCSDQPWLFLADQTLLHNLAAIKNAGIQVILYFPTEFEANGKTFHSKAITVGPDSPTLQKLLPSLASNRPTLFISPETSVYDLNHEVQHIVDFEKIFDLVTESLLKLNLNEDEFEAAYRFIFELRAYAHQLRKLNASKRALDFELIQGVVKLVPGDSLRQNLIKMHQDNFQHHHGLSFKTLLMRLKTKNPRIAQTMIGIVRRFIAADDMKVIGADDLTTELFPCESKFTQ